MTENSVRLEVVVSKLNEAEHWDMPDISVAKKLSSTDSLDSERANSPTRATKIEFPTNSNPESIMQDV